ncbi:MAG: histone deacetylase [Thermodesulfobacteriota bacterium]
MIKRETLKQAITAISERDPEIGYALNEMLSTGLLDGPTAAEASSQTHNLFFIFDQRKVQVQKFLYFNEGTSPLEDRLLIKFGEMAQRRLMRARGASLAEEKNLREIREAGLRLLVNHELNRAISSLRSDSALEDEDRSSSKPKQDEDGRRRAALFLEKIKNDESLPGLPRDENHPYTLYQGLVDLDTPAYFTLFPFCLDSLIQVADLNLEFFNVRFLLKCLLRGEAQRLFACVSNGRILGLLYVKPRRKPFYHGLEIKYIATLRGRDWVEEGALFQASPRGAGRVLVAGLWMHWRNNLRAVNELFLESELGANAFYTALGFSPRGRFEFVLRKPDTRLLETILVMANNCPVLSKPVVQEISGLLIKQVKLLRLRGGRSAKDDRGRDRITTLIKECLRSGARQEFTSSVLDTLRRYRRDIPETVDLMGLAAEHGLIHLGRKTPSSQDLAAVILDDRFSRHLEGVFHLESPKRVEVFRAALADSTLEGKWIEKAPRLASVAELSWVHTPEHIERIARTAGKPLSTLDADTQTTERSYEVARLAAGGVFNLMDEICLGRRKRGFACVRPPGHHAEPERAMGFCLFNNVALAAHYVRRRYGLGRVMIVDIDAHHGNGTQAAFYDTEQVLFISMHRFPGYPGTGKLGEVGRGPGEGFNINVPLPRHQGDRESAQIIYYLVGPVAEEYRPEIILVSCGFDLYLHDRLGEMKVTPEGYAIITALLIEIAESVSKGRLALIMEGGYSLRGIKECGLKVMQELCRTSTLTREKINQHIQSQSSLPAVLQKVFEVQKKYWKL